MSQDMELVLEFIERAKIIPNENNPRGIDIRTNDPKLGYLKDSIARFGVLVPIVVTPMRNGKYKLIDGERRYRAASAINLDLLPAFVISMDPGESLNSKDILLRMFQIHHLREQWGPIQECAALESSYDRISRKKSIKSIKSEAARVRAISEELTRSLGIDDRTATDRVKFLRWPKKIKEGLYDSLDSDGYWYMCEIEEKIIIPALMNYPEYFDKVPVDDVRRDLLSKMNVALSRATEVRAVAPYFRTNFKKKADRKKIKSVLKKLHSTRDMTYSEARDQLEQAFPEIVRKAPLSPRKLLNQITRVAAEVGDFDVGALRTVKRRSKATVREMLSAVIDLRAALEHLESELEH